MENLYFKTKKTYYIDWLTYAWSKKPGLGKFLANILTLDEEPSLLETDNDMVYHIDLDQNIIDNFDDSTDAEVSEKLENGGIEFYYLYDLFCWLHRRGHIKLGNYIVSISW